MVNHIHRKLLTNRLNKYLGRRLHMAVKRALDSILENEMNTGFQYKLAANLKQSKVIVVRSMRVSYADLFFSEREASQYVTAFFNTYSSTTIHNYLYKKKYYKTPHDGIIYIPRGEIVDYSPNGGVYGFKVNDRYFSWDYREELYYDLYNRVYSPNGEVIVGARTPRYIKEAYKQLLKVRIKEPRARIFFEQREEGYKEAVIGFDNSDFETTIFGGKDIEFSTRKYPELSTLESITPVYGSGKQAYYDFQDGDWQWGLFNTGMAVSDVFLVKSVATGVGKAVMKKGLYGGTKRYFGTGMSHSYGASVARWKKLGVNMSGSKDHWLLTQKLMKKYPWLKPIGNQTWNLKRFGSQASHMRWGHGQRYLDIQYSYWRFAYPVMATPTWFKAGVVSGSMRGIENYKRDD